MAEVVRRSWLLVSLSHEASIQHASACGADVIVLDLVELVPEGERPEARLRARDAIGSVAKGGAEVFAQVDAELLYADLTRTVCLPGLRESEASCRAPSSS
jgi:citrate lyase beta subunit